LEDPGSFVEQDNTKGFRVVGLEAFDDEFDGCVVLNKLVLVYS
jgi:hypothetical protein